MPDAVAREVREKTPVKYTRHERGNAAGYECRETHYKKLCAVISLAGSFCTETGRITGVSKRMSQLPHPSHPSILGPHMPQAENTARHCGGLPHAAQRCRAHRYLGPRLPHSAHR